jgi:hypothetical protein
VPEKIAKLVYKLLDKDPAKRINCQDANDYMNDLSLSSSIGEMKIKKPVVELSREDKLEECIQKESDLAETKEQRRFIALALPKDKTKLRKIY